LNISRFVNEQLRNYFSVDSIEQVEAEINKLVLAKIVLDKKKADLLAKGVRVSKDAGMKDSVMEELRKGFVKRMSVGVSDSGNFDWIRSPRNMSRCRSLGMDPVEVLEDLRGWYVGFQKDNLSKD
jgi:hypothetical protein